MSIVIITISGNAQTEFVNTLHRKTNGGVKLVVVQRPLSYTLRQRIQRFYQRVKSEKVTVELFYAILLRVRPDIRRVLRYFQVPSRHSVETYIPPVMYVANINAEEVHQELQAIAPDILAVWGCGVLESRIIETAKTAVNLHLGHAPSYRGALANQHAVLQEDFERVGSTIHHIASTVDSGDIIEQFTLNHSLPPQESFAELTTKTRDRFIEIVCALYNQEPVPAFTQEVTESNVMYLREWVPSIRYAVGKRLLALERHYQVAHLKVRTEQYRYAATVLLTLVLTGGGFLLANEMLQIGEREKSHKLCLHR